MSLEKQLYKPVQEFVRKRFGCYVIKQQVGTRYGKVDIVGITELRGDLETSNELIAVEVKEEKATFLSAVGQAFAYSIYAHRCYLAFRKRYKRTFTQDEIDVAAQLGIGLIEIKQKCRVVLTSKLFAPQDRYILQILYKMKYFKCVQCRAIYPLKDISSINRWAIDLQESPEYRGNLKRAIQNRRNARYWLFELSERRKDRRSYIHDRRFVCKDCLSLFASLLENRPS